MKDGLAMPESAALSSTQEIIDDIRQGRMVILVDSQDRENEGDLLIAARFADAAAINFMARHGRGLVCLSLTQKRALALDLPLMARGNEARLGTAFTVSVEAREGVTTGISAADRARTIEVCIDPHSLPRDLVSPGHVFPLVAREGGVLVRAGHTEAAIDLTRLAGVGESGVICEIMKDDGTMARLPDLMEFAAHHGLKIGTIADLIAYRRRAERLIERVVEHPIESRHGGTFKAVVYRNTLAGVEHVALVKGDIDDGRPVMVRMHAVNLFDDIVGDTSFSRGGGVYAAMRQIGREGRGVIVLLRETHRSSPSEVLFEKGKAPRLSGSNIRDYGTGAQILLDLGVKKLLLLNSPNQQLVAIEGYGLEIVDHVPYDADIDPKNNSACVEKI